MTPLDNFITSLGAMTEMWMITYEGFLRQGLTPDDAMKHTKELIDVVLKSARDIPKEDK